MMSSICWKNLEVDFDPTWRSSITDERKLAVFYISQTHDGLRVWWLRVDDKKMLDFRESASTCWFHGWVCLL